MSKVAIQGNASGTGTFTIAAPNSNTDRTLTLPDEAGTVLTSASTISGLGSLTGADIWYLTTAFVTSSSDTNEILTSNLSQFTATGTGRIGASMTQSSGVFTFPSTGIWLIVYIMSANPNGATSDYNNTQIYTTTDNSTYTNRSQSWTNVDSARYSSPVGVYIFDVADTSTHKCKFGVRSQRNIVIEGSTGNEIRTGMFFIRLGDT